MSADSSDNKAQVRWELLCVTLPPGSQPAPLRHLTLRGQWFVMRSSLSVSSRMELKRKYIDGEVSLLQ